MRIFSFLLYFLVSGFIVTAQQYSLKQCIDTALNRNILVQQTGLQMQSAEVDKNQAKMNLLPNVNSRWNYGNNFGRNVDPITNTYTNNQLSSSNAGLDAGVILFNGMRLQNLIQQTNFSHKAAELDYKQAKDNLILNVILSYMQVLVSEDVLSVSRAQLLVTKKQIERMEIMVKEGSAGNFQLTDMKGQIYPRAGTGYSDLTRFERQHHETELPPGGPGSAQHGQQSADADRAAVHAAGL